LSILLTIKSRAHDYAVEGYDDFSAALASCATNDRALWLVDRRVAELHGAALAAVAPAGRTVLVAASEERKSFEALTPIFLELLQRGLKRDGLLVVVGGGVLQDIGCFIASVLFRGLRWELVPTTLLAQADSCIGSKSSINIGPYKNQIGTFYPPHRVALATSVLATLPWDEIRSGLGEVIKLQVLHGEGGFRELMGDLPNVRERPDHGRSQVSGVRSQSETEEVLGKWVARSLAVKQPYIEEDEFDRGRRNILNYGHTFGHAYESATQFAIPHGIAVVLGLLTATSVSARLGIVPREHYAELKGLLAPWHEPFGQTLKQAPIAQIFQAIKHDKKNTGEVVNCILTRGFGKMEKRPVPFEEVLVPAVRDFIADEI
jgi:3-dehydroquinate synthase